jgi:hypothetical protein
MRTIRVLAPLFASVVLLGSMVTHAAEAGGEAGGPLEATVESPPAVATFWEITDAARLNEVRASFQAELDRLGVNGKLIDCGHAVEVSSIREAASDVAGGHDLSYGASCTLDVGTHRLWLLMCNDTMVGKFTMTSWGGVSRERLVHFIRENCPPGG